VEGLVARAAALVEEARTYADAVRGQVLSAVSVDGCIVPAKLQQLQRMVHGYAWVETLVATLASTAQWAKQLEAGQSFHDGEALVVRILFGEYAAQLLGGIPLSQNELARPGDLAADDAAARFASSESVRWFLANGNSADARSALVAHIVDGREISDTLGDEMFDAIRDQYRRFVDTRIIPHAHGWHLANALIPQDIIDEMAALGTFGVSIDEEYGGLGLGKLVMCVVTEELSRGWIGVGSLGTRSEIAGELILRNGTAAQKQRWLSRIASGEILPTAVFTEPDNGSDLGGLRTRAERTADGGWTITGNKTWITHASRSDMMTLLARTVAGTTGYDGLTMFLLPKERGTDAEPFPNAGMSGGEIEVLGYRGMREYELSFEGFAASEDAVLGGGEGQGFRQLMNTFEGARVQTAARAVGVARRAFDLGLRYATERKQFGQRLVDFPRVHDKLALMLAEIVGARELTYFAALEKDKGRRCDIEAGMAKLLAARVAWGNADASLQIHGGNGYALEFEISRVLCDARILNVFEGAAEIQAQIVARGCLGRVASPGTVG
jgi:(2S)-methylsuccinyl-CoA dehydrogenase